MMYVSCLVLDPTHKDARLLLSDPYRVHQRILNAWDDAVQVPWKSGAGPRVLFRVEDLREPPRLIVQAPAEADWHRAFPADRGLLEPPTQKHVAPKFARGERLRFLLRANPTARRPARDPETGEADFSKPGKRVGLLKEEEQFAWLERQGEVQTKPGGQPSGGFRICRAEIRRHGEVTSRRRGTGLTHQGVEFEGILEVTDPEALLETLRQGVGSGKGLGFGMLSLARLRPLGGA